MLWQKQKRASSLLQISLRYSSFQTNKHMISKALLEREDLEADAAQWKVAKKLDALASALTNYNNSAVIAYAERVEELQRRRSAIQHQHQHQHQHQQEEEEQKGETGQMENGKEEEKRKIEKKKLEREVVALERERPRIPRGIYIHGSVGTGKSMLMDLFYSHSPVPKAHCQRWHFHAFLQHIHKRIHHLKQMDLNHNGRNFKIDLNVDHNPIVRVARSILSNDHQQKTFLLCLDEFHVTDVADALILRQLFQVLWTRGMVLVTTSNRSPSQLYEGGINRSYFLPFIDLLQNHCIIHQMTNQDVDYRRRILSTADIPPQKDHTQNEGTTTMTQTEFYFVDNNANGSNSSKAATNWCNHMIHQQIQPTITIHHKREKEIADNNDSSLNYHSVTLDVGYQRTFLVQHALSWTPTAPSSSSSQALARFHFDELCSADLAASDYRAIAQTFDFVMIESIPHMSKKHHDRARRFVTLIDELYEAGCCLYCTGVAESPDSIFESANETTATDNDPIELKVGEAFGIDVAQTINNNSNSSMTGMMGELASVRELSFAFDRASSRLIEMTSQKGWLRRSQHRKDFQMVLEVGI